MTEYYVLDCMSSLEAEHYSLDVGYPANDKRWHAGLLFSPRDERETCQPPSEPIEIRTEEGADDPHRIYPELTWVPIPLMSRRLVEALRAAGVDNLQTYETRLVTTHGQNRPAPDHYLAVNVVGLVAAADFAKSKTKPEVLERMISTDFYSLAVDADSARGQLLFRLAENVSAVLAHEHVKKRVEARGIDTLTWMQPEDWAG